MGSNNYNYWYPLQMTNFLFYLSIGDIKDGKMAIVELATIKSPNILPFEYVLVSNWY